MTKLFAWTAQDLASAIVLKEISCQEAVQSCLSRIDDINPRVNALAEICREEALLAARNADQKVARGGRLGPLHGVPVTVKINVDQAGWATSNGVKAFKELRAAEDSPIVKNLKSAGAIIIGRSNTPAFSFRWFTSNEAYGSTLNPSNPLVTAGGSSGGAAAAVACGMGPISHGNDMAGSIRYPASVCGVYGLRPTNGRVPAYNPAALPERPIGAHFSSVQGALARSVGDVQKAYEAMCNYDVRDPWCVPNPKIPTRRRKKTASICSHLHGYEIDDVVKDAVNEAGKRLEREGYDVVEAAPPMFTEAAELWMAINMTEAAISTRDSVRKYGDERIVNAFESMLSMAKPLSLEGYIAACSQRTKIMRVWADFFNRYSVLLMPNSWRKPFLAEFDQQPGAMEEIIAAQTPLLATAILGMPGLSAPVLHKDGLHVGVQLISARFAEQELFAAALALERQYGPLKLSE